MTRLPWIVNLVAALGVGAGSFWATRAIGEASAPPGGPVTTAPGRGAWAMARWLRMSARQGERLRRADPGWPEDAWRLREELSKQREALAALLEDAGATDQAVLAQVDKVSDTQGRLERRVVEHLLKVRALLTPPQRRRLLEMVARGVRRHGQGRRGGQGMGPGPLHTRPGGEAIPRGPAERMQRGRQWRDRNGGSPEPAP